MDERVISIEPFPPWKLIKREMDARDWTQDDLAGIMGRSRQHINRLLQGKTSITPETAIELSNAFATSAALWMNLQTSYELSKAAKEDRSIERRAQLYEKFPVRELVKRHWIADTGDADELESEICKALGTPKIDSPLNFAVSARKGASYASDNGPQAIWYARAYRLAECVSAKKFTEKRFADGLETLRGLMAYPEDTRRVPKALADMGVRLVILQHLPKSRIDGAAFWINGSPVVAMSLRFDRIDNFWFTLIHELMHIKNRDGQIVDVNLLGEDESELPEEEVRANKEAADFLVSRDKLTSFVARTRPLYYQKKVVQFAQARGVHPAIVVGQLKYMKELPPTHLNKLQAKIRHEIVGQALTDGWGHSPDISTEN